MSNKIAATFTIRKRMKRHCIVYIKGLQKDKTEKLCSPTPSTPIKVCQISYRHYEHSMDHSLLCH